MPKLFGTDGVRGTVGQWPLIPEFALKLGQAAGAVLAADSERALVIVGRDTRQSGQMLQNALTAGLLAAGVNVMDLGVITTPGVSWLTSHLGAAAGGVISASHNPVEQNGIKFFDARGMKLAETVEEEIEQLVGSQSSNPAGLKDPQGLSLGRMMEGRGINELYVRGLSVEHPDL